MPGPLKNARHERFAQELAKGRTHGEAHALAGYKRDDKNAARLTKNDGVAARIAELKGRAAEKVIATVADLSAQLDEDRAFARELENPSAAVTATMGKAKLLGHLVDRVNADLTSGGRPLGLSAFYGHERPSDD